MPDGTRVPNPRQAERISADFWSTFDGTAAPPPVDERGPLTTFEAYLKIYGRPLGGARRARPRDTDRKRIRERQNNQCLYCEQPIGSMALRRGEPIELRPNWDHFVPYVYAQRNGSDNWVLACHICNGIKHGKIFETVVEAQDFIRSRWRTLGIEALDPELQRRLRMIEQEANP